MDTQKWVKFNVRGSIFLISNETLRNCKEGMFEAMFSERWPRTYDNDGCIFIDRSPRMFHYVTEFLMDGYVPKFRPGSEKLMALMKEADYFGLEELLAELQKSTVMPAPRPVKIYNDLGYRT